MSYIFTDWPHREMDDPPPPVPKMTAADLGLEGPVWVTPRKILVRLDENGLICEAIEIPAGRVG